VETNAVCIYSQLKSFSSSEVAAMIEGLIRHDTEMRVEKNFVDSHGQSEVAFAFCHLLGTVRLMPRLKRLKYERLYLPDKGTADQYPHLAGTFARAIRGDLIAQQYDEMVKAAVALKRGTATAEAILKRYNSYNVTHPTYNGYSRDTHKNRTQPPDQKLMLLARGADGGRIAETSRFSVVFSMQGFWPGVIRWEQAIASACTHASPPMTNTRSPYNWTHCAPMPPSAAGPSSLRCRKWVQALSSGLSASG
jgi:hypothetical protein